MTDKVNHEQEEGFEEYEVSSESARRADDAGNKLNDYGAFTGKIEDFVAWSNDKGWKGFILTFASQFDGVTRQWIMTKDPEGKLSNSKKWVDGLLILTGVKRLVGELRKEEDKEGKEVTVRFYPELIGKDVGVIFNKIRNEKGFDAVNIVGLYNPKNNLTPSEIIDGRTTPKLKDKIIKSEARFIDKSKKGTGQAVNEDADTPLAGNYDV